MAATWMQLAQRSVQSVQLLTEAAPAALSDGMIMEGVLSIAPTIHAPVGQTFTGAGKLLGYALRNGLWVPMPRANVPLDEAAGLQDADLAAIPVDVPRDRFALIAFGVGLSGAGTQITLEMWAVNARGLEAT